MLVPPGYFYFASGCAVLNRRIRTSRCLQTLICRKMKVGATGEVWLKEQCRYKGAEASRDTRKRVLQLGSFVICKITISTYIFLKISLFQKIYTSSYNYSYYHILA